MTPVFAFVDPGTAIPLEITRAPGPAKEDKLVVQYLPAPETMAAPQDAFQTGGTGYPELPVTLQAA